MEPRPEWPALNGGAARERRKKRAAAWWAGPAAKAGLPVLLFTGASAAAVASLVASHFVTGSPESARDVLSVFQRRPAARAAASAPAPAPAGWSPSLEELSLAARREAVASSGSKASRTGTVAEGSAASDAGAVPAAPPRGIALAAGPFARGRGWPGAAASAAGTGVVPSGDAESAFARAFAPAPRDAPAAGRLAAFGVAARAGSGARAALGRARPGSGALSQAFAAYGANRWAASSQAGGVPYDTPRGPAGGAKPGAAASSAAGSGLARGNQPKTLPLNSAPQLNKQQAPPVPPSVPVTPWQGAIRTAEFLLGLAAFLLFVVGKAAKLALWARYAAVGLAAALGGAVIALGAQVSGGAYGQVLQGGILAAAGLGVLAAAALAMRGLGAAATKPGPPASGTPLFVWLGGGAALLALAAVQLAPPRAYPSRAFEGGRPPDAHWFG